MTNTEDYLAGDHFAVRRAVFDLSDRRYISFNARVSIYEWLFVGLDGTTNLFVSSRVFSTRKRAWRDLHDYLKFAMHGSIHDAPMNQDNIPILFFSGIARRPDKVLFYHNKGMES